MRDIQRPKIDFEAAYDDQKLGTKITRQFRRYGVPFTAYDLRHAHALRASVTLGFPVTTAAALLGHNPELHLKTYNKHISRSQNKRASDAILNNPNRPKPPSAYRDQSPTASDTLPD